MTARRAAFLFVFSAYLDGPPDPWASPEYLRYIDWPVARASVPSHALKAKGKRPKQWGEQ